jgi:PAS domain S-box-containing protein
MAIDTFMPHGMCYLWRPDILALHIGSDLLIFAAYSSIPFTLLYFVRKRKDLEFDWMFVCFAVFIVACGMTHLMEIWVIWHPVYWLSGTIKAITAMASVPTAILLVRLVPTALALPSPTSLRKAHASLEREVAERRVAEQALQLSERRRAEEAMREQAEILDLAQVFVRGPEGRIIRWTRGAEKLYGYTHEQAVGSISHQLLHSVFPEPLEKLAAQLEAAGTWQGQVSQRTRYGNRIDVASTWILHRDAEGNPARVLESNSDITDKMRAEGRLAEQLGRLHLLNRITHAIGERQDLPSIFQVVLGALEDQLPIDFGCISQYQPADGLIVAGVGIKSHAIAMQLGLNDQTRLVIDENGLTPCVHGELVTEPDLAVAQFELPRRLATAGLRSMVAAPLILENHIFGVLLVARSAPDSFSSDECEFLGQLGRHVALAAHQAQLYRTLEVAYEDLRQSQQAIMRQEKLRVLGQMASGIAHDINNALSPAALYVESLLERASIDPEGRSQLAIVQRAIEGVAQTVARMKEFYSQRDPQLAHRSVSINSTIAQVIELTKARWNAMPQESGRVIQINTDFAQNLPDVAANESEIRDAITNLILNAVDAMPGGGTITLRSSALSSDRVQIDVTDTGVGMDEATRSRCLELFFTTKGARGTGLGLAMVYGTIERHGGDIQIHSEPGVGTNVRLTLPAVAVPASVGHIARGAASPPNRLKLLVVDDDPIVLKSLRDTLERDGHVVEIADGGQRGIDAFHAAFAKDVPFDVVITDLGMPHVDGRAVAAAIKIARRQTKVVLLTGWGHRMVAENEKPPNVDRVLGKPPKMTILRTALAELTNGVPA